MTTKTIPEEIAELRAMDVPSLVAKYEAVFGRAPRVKHREFLWKRIAWKIQEQRFGGLSDAAKRRLDELIAEIDLPLGEATRTVTGRLASARSSQLAVGTTITREWRGQQITVRVVQDGIEWNGVPYRSLSAVAKAVTGTHWNGPLFFGLSKERKR
jgi:hypothetical protein